MNSRKHAFKPNSSQSLSLQHDCCVSLSVYGSFCSERYFRNITTTTSKKSAPINRYKNVFREKAGLVQRKMLNVDPLGREYLVAEHWTGFLCTRSRLLKSRLARTAVHTKPNANPRRVLSKNLTEYTQSSPRYIRLIATLCLRGDKSVLRRVRLLKLQLGYGAHTKPPWDPSSRIKIAAQNGSQEAKSRTRMSFF